MACSICWRRRVLVRTGTAINRSPPRTDRVEDLLRPVDVQAGVHQRVLGDDRVLALALDLADAVGPGQEDAAVPDLVLVAVERAHRRAGCDVALRGVGAAVARAGERGRVGGDARDDAVRGLRGLLVRVLE